MKCEPSAYTIEDLAQDGTTSWEGVRNYQARNFMRDKMRVGDGVLFYASNADPSGVTGIAKVVRSGYPDHFAWKKGHRYFDARSNKSKPVWFMVDIRADARLAQEVTLEEIKAVPALADMFLITRPRLSVQPVDVEAWELITQMGAR